MAEFMQSVMVAQFAAGIGAGIIILGVAIGLGRIAAAALEGTARQPEASGQMFLAWLLPCVLLEGVAFFALVVCIMVNGVKPYSVQEMEAKHAIEQESQGTGGGQ